jgi:uncharacterized protein (UPF0548 family)
VTDHQSAHHSAELSYPARLRGLSIPLARGASYLRGPWNVLWESRIISRDRSDFTRARSRILSWQMHRQAGVRVEAGGVSNSSDVAGVVPGLRVTLSIGVGPIMIPAPCEVITVIDSDHEAGFAYGTLPGHPEQGEEAFLARMTDDGTVVGSVAAFSRPVPWASVGAPVIQRAQRIIARRYLSAMLP